MAKVEKKKPKKDWRIIVLEWLEAIATAVFLAMFTRHFLVEPFKIPTGSMQPTLWGERSNTDVYTLFPALRALYPNRPGGGDKVLVNKSLYDFRKPQRWEIIVFKFPQDASVNYIKRLWGLPGEELQVREGDVWINGSLARKPPKIQNVLWLCWFDEALIRNSLKIAPQRLSFLPEARAAEADPLDVLLREAILRDWSEKEFRTQLIGMTGGRLILKADQGEQPLELAYGPVIKDYRGYVMRDLCLDFDIGTTAKEGELILKLSRDDHHFSLNLPFAGGRPPLVENGQPHQPDMPVEGQGSSIAALNDGKPHHVEFSNADGAVRLFIDKQLVFENSYDLAPTGEMPGEGSSHAAFGAAHAQIAVWNLRLRHDVHYTNPNDVPGARERATYGMGEPYRIPEDRYFFLGDNSGNSLDSRMWGTVPERYLLGEAFFIFRPLQRWRFVN